MAMYLLWRPQEFSLLRFMQMVMMSAMLGSSIPLIKGRPPGKSRSAKVSCEADCPRRKERDLSKYQSSLTGEDHLILTITKGLHPRSLSLSYRTGRVLSEARSWVALRWMEASLRKPSLRVLSSKTEFYPEWSFITVWPWTEWNSFMTMIPGSCLERRAAKKGEIPSSLVSSYSLMDRQGSNRRRR